MKLFACWAQSLKLSNCLHAAVMLLLFPLTAIAAEWSGTVYLGGEPLHNTELTIVDLENNVLTSTDTDESGYYSFEVDSGEYNLVITPPATLGMSNTLIENVRVDSTPLIYHFVLLEPEVVLSGVVKGLHGSAANGVQLAIFNHDSKSNTGYVTTDANGSYRFAIPTGVYDVVAFGNGGDSNINLPDQWRISPVLSRVELESDQTSNIILPNVTLNGLILSPDFNLVSNVALSVQKSWQQEGVDYMVRNYSHMNSTDETGEYHISLFNNVSYNIQLAPSTNSGYGNKIVENYYIAGNQSNDFILDEANYLSGILKTSNNKVIDNATIFIYENTTGMLVGVTTTSDSGYYSIALTEGEYRIDAGGPATESNVLLPRSWFMKPAVHSVIVRNNTTQDIIIPFVKLSGEVINENGNPISNVEVQLDEKWRSDDIQFAVEVNESHIITDNNGKFEFYTIPNSNYSVNAIPLNNSAYAPSTDFHVPVTGDTHQVFVLQNTVRVFGQVRTTSGEPIDGIRVEVVEQITNQSINEVITQGDGSFEFYLKPGVFDFNVIGRAADSSITMPQYWQVDSIVKSLEVNDSIQQDIIVPFLQVSGRILDAGGQIVSGVQLEIKQSWDTDEGKRISINNSRGYITSDNQGNYSALLFAFADYDFSLTPPEGVDMIAETIEGVGVGDNQTMDLWFSPTVTLNGLVKSNSGVVLGGANLTFRQKQNNQVLATTQSNKAGEYNVTLWPDTYLVDVSGSETQSPRALPKQWRISPVESNLHVLQNKSHDIVLPLVELRGKAIDSNGVPVPGVEIQFNKQWREQTIAYQVLSYGQHWISDAQGNYRILVFPYPFYTEEVLTPEYSGFVNAAIYGFELIQDTKQDIVLSLPDTTPPFILSGPNIHSVSDSTAIVEWQTDEPSMAQLDYGVSNSLLSSATYTELKRNHTVLLTQLNSNTRYYLTVSATDFNNNGPVVSDQMSFETNGVVDNTAPIILEGPNIDSITPQGARVTWITNKPSSSAVLYGKTQNESVAESDLVEVVHESTLVTRHELLLSNLTENTKYSTRVSSNEASTNSPVVSGLYSFTTGLSPDNTAPHIIAGPLVTNITDHSATIEWRTDEPASSGVSYNDGSNYGLVKDTNLVTSHVVHLNGLSANTRYGYTVSSSDRHGNGPTIEPGISFTTAEIIDELAPIVIDGPHIINITHQSAVIRWETDEPGDSLIEYGTQADKLDQYIIRPALVNNHNIPLVELSPGTEYFFRVFSADAARNQSIASAVHSFTTDLVKVNKQLNFTNLPQVVQQDDTTVTISWETNKPTDGVLEYSIDGVTYRREQSETNTQNHITLAGLEAGSQYNYKIFASDTDKQLLQSGNLTFTTSTHEDISAPHLVSDVVIKIIDESTVRIDWHTNELADALVQYNISNQPLNLLAGDINKQFQHSMLLTKLVPDTQYDFTITAKDMAGNSFVSAVMLFSTADKGELTAATTGQTADSQGGGQMSPFLLWILFNVLCLAQVRTLSFKLIKGNNSACCRHSHT